MIRLCRICLAQEDESEFNQISAPQAEEITYSCDIQISLDDFALICEKCSDDVRTAAKIKKVAQISDTYFKQQQDIDFFKIEVLDENVIDFEEETIVETLEEEIEDIPCGEVDVTVKTEENVTPKKLQGIKKSFQCDCGIVFSSSYRLQNHIRVKHEFVPESEMFSCKDCGKRFKIREYLDIHVRNKHSKIGVKSREKNPCSICGKVLSSLTCLKNHEAKHLMDSSLTPVKPYICDHCGLTFRLKSYIFNHMNNVHYRQKYPCTFCPRAFYKKYELVDHFRLHTNEKPFICDFEGCSKSFTRKKNLNIHQRIHLNIRPYACNFCEKSFVHFIDRKRHMMKHTGERPHQCNICNKGFLRKTEMLAHMKTHVAKSQSVQSM